MNMFSRIALTIIVLLIPLDNAISETAQLRKGKTTNYSVNGVLGGPKHMGVDNCIQLFNLRVYRNRVVPVYKEFFEKDNAEPLIALLEEIIKQYDVPKRPAMRLDDSKKMYEGVIRELRSTKSHSSANDSPPQSHKKTTEDMRDYVQHNLGTEILKSLCLTHDNNINPNMNITGSYLGQYLSQRSEWIEELLMGERLVSGGTLDYSLAIGESSELFTKEEVQDFNRQLSKIPVPEDNLLKKDYDNLLRVVRMALGNPDLTLLHSLS